MINQKSCYLAKTLALFIAFSFQIRNALAQQVEITGPAVGTQYDTTHVYVAPADFNRFVVGFIATFGGYTTKQGIYSVTPTPSRTISQLC